MKEKIRNIGVAVSGAGASDAGTSATSNQRVKWVDVEAAFKRRIRTGMIVNLRHKDLTSFFDDAKNLVKSKLISVMKEQGNLKVNDTLDRKIHLKEADTIIEEEKTFQTESKAILSLTDIVE